MRWHRRGPGDEGPLRRDKVLRMKAKRNRYYLSLWDVRKLSLYGRARESVQAATLNLESFGRQQLLGRSESRAMDSTCLTTSLCFWVWITLLQPRRNKT